MWVAEHEDDVLVDVLRFLPQFGIDPLEVMDGPTLFKVAPRLAAYGGVVTTRFSDVDDQPAAQTAASRPAEVSGIRVPAGADVVPLSALMHMHGDLVERKEVTG